MKMNLITLLFAALLCIVIPAAALPEQPEQLALIADNAEVWKQEDVFGLWGYTVSDLDRNGLLEIISASIQGSGAFTYMKIYEVNEDGKSLAEVSQDRPEYDSAPDILAAETAPVYYDPETGDCFYIFTDHSQNGYAEQYEAIAAVTLSDRTWNETWLAHKATVYSDPEHFTETFTDNEGNEISQQLYDSIAADRFAGYEEGILTLHWHITDGESLPQLSRDELIAALSEISEAAPVKTVTIVD